MDPDVGLKEATADFCSHLQNFDGAHLDHIVLPSPAHSSQ